MNDDVLWLLLVMATGPGLSLDPFKQVVNVHWDDGLAVEFFRGANGEQPTA